MPINKIDGKKNGKQKYRVRVNYTDDFGKPQRIERTVYGLDAARAAEIEIEHRISGKTETLARMTVQALYDEYMAAKRAEVRETTAAKRETIYRTHIKYLFENTTIDKLKPPILQKWKIDIESRGLSLKMKQNIFSVFRAILNYAVKMNYIPQNPLKNVGNFRESVAIKKQMQFYTPEQFLKYIAVANKTADNGSVQDTGFYVFFMLAYYTGARKGEINALRWCDIDGSMINIARSIAQKISGGDRITAPKNAASIRSIQIPTPLSDALAAYRLKCEQVDGFNDECLICGFDRALRDTSIEKRNIAYAAAAGLPHIRIHDFRHSHASLLANSGINIQEIARRLGHSDIEMTWNTYSHLYPREQERAIDVLNTVK